MYKRIAGLVISILGSVTMHAAENLVFRLPTENDALFKGDHEAFYMYCDRIFEGETSKPWQAGTFGYTRTPLRAYNKEIIYTKLHEGIDIKPLHRDANNVPLDPIKPMAPGTVVYTSNSPGASNYGRYVVIAHDVPEGTIYSLYAHLGKVSCTEGQQVSCQDTIGILGYSGAGINKTRAHCHVELCLLVHADFNKFCPANNKHGLFNGHNLIGINVEDVLLHCKDGQAFSLREYFGTLKEYFRVRVPREAQLDIILRYPFLYKGEWGKEPVALEFAFTQEGIPIAIYPSDIATEKPVVTRCTPMPLMQRFCTAGRLDGKSTTAFLTSSGQTFIKRFIWHEPTEEAPND